MSSAPAPKRKRAPSITDIQPRPSPVDPALSNSLSTLDNATIRQLLLDIASQHPATRIMIFDALKAKQDRERARVVDFDHYSKQVWYAINIEHKKLSGVAQYDRAFDVADEVCGVVRRIAKEVYPYSAFETKKNAMETLRKIGKTILLGECGCVGHEVRKSFQYPGAYQDAMDKVLRCMSGDEKRRMREDDGGEFVQAMKQLVAMSQSYCTLKSVESAFDILMGGISVDENEDENESEDEDDDDDEDVGED